jgi:excinuclease UvrABC ATPase subunit
VHATRLVAARTHNLKDVSLELREGELVCLTGVSGAGKSSLALDTLYAEGQRRFVESFSPYARQFLERLERPPMDGLEPVAAGIAVDGVASDALYHWDVDDYAQCVFVGFGSVSAITRNDFIVSRLCA